MQEEHGIIGKILAKYPVITDEEQEVLNDWLAKNGNRQKFNLIIDNEAREIDLNRFLRIRERKEANREKYYDAIANLSTKKGVAWFKKWPTYVAAASILVAVSIIGYKWFSGSDQEFEKEKPIIVQNKNKDVAPGQYKARLTLADGSVVVLDSFSSSKLVQQGSTTVLTRDGQLVYEKKGKDHEVLYNVLTTAKGETYGMVLSDGSKVWLNSQSSIRYPVSFNGDIRKVEITGEAYFEVASLSQKIPFIVSLNGMEVEVLGTHFNINSYSDEDVVKTTLLEGKVKVKTTSNHAETILQPGQQANWNKRNQGLHKLNDVDVDEAVAWHNGYFQFNNADLETVLKQLVRWYDVEVRYQGNIPQREFWGKISRENTLSQVLGTLETNNVHFKLEGKRIFVSP